MPLKQHVEQQQCCPDFTSHYQWSIVNTFSCHLWHFHMSTHYLIIGVNYCRHLSSWERLDWAKSFVVFSSLFFFFFSFFFLVPSALFDQVNYEQCIRALFTDPQIPLFNNFFIKNGSHDTIHTFKNYFPMVFSVSAKINSIQTDPMCFNMITFYDLYFKFKFSP